MQASSKLFGRIAWSIWIAYSLVVVAGLAWFGPRMQPIPRGTAIDFWEAACGVDLDPKRSSWGGAAYYVGEDWVAYERSHMHGSDLYRVPTAEAEPLLPAVVESLQAQQDSGETTRFVKGFAAWRKRPVEHQSMKVLIECQQDALHDAAYADRGIRSLTYVLYEEQSFWQRWERAKWYWSNFVFEWLLLSGLGLFALWPAIRGLSLYRWAAHASLLPLLFLLPAYLGYATWSFTSAGPCGGVLYPFLLQFARGGSINVLDRFVLAHLPRLLEPLSSSPGIPTSISGGMCGPSSAIQAGLLLAAAVFAIGLIVRYVRNRRARLNDRAALPVQ